MANPEHLAILKQGVTIWNEWREEHPTVRPDLTKVDLPGADLRYANLMYANLGLSNLQDANLTSTRLDWAQLHRSNLTGAQFVQASMGWTNFDQADLSHANLSDSHLIMASFLLTILYKADLSNADLLMTDFRQANLQEAILRKVNLQEAVLREANLSGADLSEANLSGALLIGANLNNANLAGCKIYGASVWNVQLEGAKQENLIITPPNVPIITVDNLEIAQFVYMLLERKKLRNALNSVMDKGVLLLGRFGGGGLELLQAIAEKLRRMNYLPIIFDFDRPESGNLTETVMTLVGLSRFVIVDLSGPSVPNELRSTVPHFRIPFVPIIEDGRKYFSMFSDFLENDWVLSPVAFSSKEDLLELLPSKVIEPAEKKCQERQLRLKEIFDR